MQKILRSPASIRRKTQRGTFGVPLTDLSRSTNGELQVPMIVVKIVEYILANGLNTEGIFRINGSTKAVDKMKERFDRSKEVDLDDAGDIMAVAGLLKMFLRELPEPLMTSGLHEKFIILQRGFQNRQDSEDYLVQLKNLIKQLPEEHQMVLSYLIKFLTKVMDHQDKNKMSSKALAIVFGPNLFRCCEGVAGLQEQAYTNIIVRTMIEEYNTLFGAEEVDEIEINSKRILVKPADSIRSPPIKQPLSYEAYLKERIGKFVAKKEAETVKDVNSNSLASKERGKTKDSRQDTVSPCEVSSADERAMSPFNLDSDSTVPSPVVSDSAIEVVNRTIKECVGEFLYGTPDENAPVPNPRTKRLQKKQREEALHALPSHLVDTEESSSKRAKKKGSRQDSIDSLESMSPPTTPLPARALSESPAFRLFESNAARQPAKSKKAAPARPEVKKTDRDLNNTETPTFRRIQDLGSPDRASPKEEAEEGVFVDFEPIPDKATAGRAPSPIRHTPSPRSSVTRSKSTPEEGVPTQLTELDLDSVQREAPVLSKLTRGRSQGPKRRSRSRSRSRDRSESDSLPWSPPENGHSELANGSAQQQSPDQEQSALITPPKAKHKLGGAHRVLAEAAMAKRRQQRASESDKPESDDSPSTERGRGSPQDRETGSQLITPPKPKHKIMGGTPNLLAQAAMAARRTQQSPEPAEPASQLITPPKPKYKMGGTPNLLAEAAAAARKTQTTSKDPEPAPQMITPPKPKHKTMGGTPNILAGAAMAAVLKKKQGTDVTQEGCGRVDNRSKERDITTGSPVSPSKQDAVTEETEKGHRGKHHHHHHHEKLSKSNLDAKQEADGETRTKRGDKGQQKSPKRRDKKRERLIGRDDKDLHVQDVDSPEVGEKEVKHAGRTKSHERLTNGREEVGSMSVSPRSPRPGGMEDDDASIPSLDLSTLHVNTESEEPIPAWEMQHRTDWMNKMEELTIDVHGGPIEKLAKSWEEAPLSPRAKDTPPCWGSATIESERKDDNPVDRTQNMKQLTRQIRSLKRKIRQYEEEYSEQHGHKPSTAEKAAEPEVRKMMKELKRAAKQLKAARDDSEINNEPLHSTMPPARRTLLQEDSNSESSNVDSLRDAMDLAGEWLKEKRREAGRMDDIFEMSKLEVHDEKVSIQKVLLQLESKFGRPTTTETKEIMKPLYDRYRNLKRLIAKFEVRRTLGEEVTGSATDLNTIEENEETKEFTPKQMGLVHTMYAEEDDLGMVTQEVPPTWGRGHGEETIQSPVDLGGRADSPMSPDSTANFKNLTDAPMSELIKAQNQALNDKKKVRRVLKEYEDNFNRDRGRKVQKEDRGPMEDEYNQYKQIKKQLKLLETLMEKHESQGNTGVT